MEKQTCKRCNADIRPGKSVSYIGYMFCSMDCYDRWAKQYDPQVKESQTINESWQNK